MTDKTLTPTSRMSNPLDLIPEIAEVSAALFKATGNGSVPRTTFALMHLRAGQIVGNTYLTVFHSNTLRSAGESEERITAVASWRDAPYFTDAERAALALVEGVLLPNRHGERVTDGVYAEAARHYDAKALATLMVAIGQVNFFIPFALIGRPLPGKAPAEQWT
ncbi:carboxymuconolactone decarboxylase family protein [Streptomyces sp. UNOB3_S3]|uniref:carboxymuconolactone decarboxylase family protein n=1 Tax=Streptomyces sp. UNOB3_S3 TaxID=2871682 RepID=UPI001E305BC8|nr:carboxymuconolactone decarboxylase family protein [Streptomyces sp. UNOB3_S3]MCC3776018.1 carboxymuconolactone decarboxylase family protein [Streptomyces sp. UNOB3_S3]